MSPAVKTSSTVKTANGSASSSHRPPNNCPRSIASQLEPLKVADVNRSSSIRLEDISSPRLQSSTNQKLTGSDSKLQPTRAAPAPPAAHKPPQRPPPPVTHHDHSPTGPPPAPPDSRHLFYSTQLPRQPADDTDVIPATSVSTMRSRFEQGQTRNNVSVPANKTRPVSESQCWTSHVIR